MLRQASTVDSMTRADQRPAVVPLSAGEEAFLRAWSRAALTVPRALDADLLAGQGMSLSEYTALMHLSEAPGRHLRMSELASACALSLSGMSRIVSRLEAQGLVQRERASCDGRGLNAVRSEEHTSELQSLAYLVCRLLLEKKKMNGACIECAP